MAAAGTTATILLLNCGGQIDVGYVGDGGQPCQHIGELFFEVIAVVSSTERSCQFADFFHQPHKRSGDPTLRVFFVVHRMDQGLEIAKRDFRRSGRGGADWT